MTGEQKIERLDPLTILADAKRQLMRTRNLIRDEAAWTAYRILLGAQTKVRQARTSLPFPNSENSDTTCIAEILGEKARAKGCVCPCPKCQAERDSPGSGVRSPKQEKIRNGKMAAAHDVENSE